jgi:hypothetical protein
MESWSRSALYEVANGGREASGESPGAFFLTLCPVTAPVSLPEPKSPSLQRFRFFFSKQVENGVERCWLHFGYFRNVQEAQKWREVLHRVYPGAAIHTVPQALGSQSLSDSQVLALLKNSPGAGAETKASTAAPSKPDRHKSSLEDTLSELRDSAWRTLDVDPDEVSSTGVRHLRVEVQAKPRAKVTKLNSGKRKS